MSRQLVLCVRFGETPVDAARYLDLVHHLEGQVSTRRGHLVAWSADRFSFCFPREALDGALGIAALILSQVGDHSLGIAHRELSSRQGLGGHRSWGLALVLAEALANAARPGELLVDPELTEWGHAELAALGFTKVRLGDVVLRATLLMPKAEGSGLEAEPKLEGSRSSRASVTRSAAPKKPVSARSLGPSTPETSGPPPPPKPGSAAPAPSRSGPPSHPPLRQTSVVPPKPSVSARAGQNASPPPKPKSRAPSVTAAGLEPVSPPVDEPELPGVPQHSRPPGPKLRPEAASALASGIQPSLRPERPSVVEALRSGNPESMLALADQLKGEPGQEALARRLEAMARLARGEVGHGLSALREAATTAKLGNSKNQGRAALALAVGLLMAGRKEEALLQGLEALARARARDDQKGELACASFISQLARAAGRPVVADAWLPAQVASS